MHETSTASQKVWDIYNKLIEKFGNEFTILLDAPEPELAKIVDKRLASIIINNREAKVRVQPGYDGEYGIPLLNGENVQTYIPTDEDLRKAPRDMKEKQVGLGQWG